MAWSHISAPTTTWLPAQRGGAERPSFEDRKER